MFQNIKLIKQYQFSFHPKGMLKYFILKRQQIPELYIEIKNEFNDHLALKLSVNWHKNKISFMQLICGF